MTHSPERHDKADFFRQRNEGGGRDQSLFRMIPADQRLETADLVALQGDHRLVVELEFASGQRLAQILLHDATGLHLLVHRGFEKAECAAPVAFGAIEREVGVSQQRVGARSVARTDRNADAGADDGLVAAEVIRLAQQLDDAFGERRGLGGIRDGRLDDDEFIAAHPRDGVGLPHQSAQPVGDHLQQPIADGMTERIVDGLELVEIEVMNRQHLVALDPAEGAFEPLVEQHPVGEIGQRIVVGHMLDLDLGPALFGDVFMGCDPAEVGHRPMADLERAPVAQFDNAVGRLGRYRNVGAPVQVFVAGHCGKAAGLETQIDNFGQGRAGADAIGRQVVHLDVTIVAHDQSMIGVEEA